MVSLKDYVGREQTYVKHVFLSQYFERLVFKTASHFDHIAYIDGFAGPWQSANKRYEDTSFGIALNALRRAKASLRTRQRGLRREVNMSALLVEQDNAAYASLARIKDQYPDVTVIPYNDNFLSIVPTILNDIPRDAFAFFLIDPKGWRINIKSLSSLLRRNNSEVVFNFMFDFINRAASMRDPVIAKALDELIPYGDWRAELERVHRASGGRTTTEQRKSILVAAFRETLSRIGNYPFVAETTVFRTVANRPLYYLFYATRHSTGLQVFRDCQIKTLEEQSATRAAVRVQRNRAGSGQGELFESLHEMGPDETAELLADEREVASHTLLELAPPPPAFGRYGDIRAAVMTKHIVKSSDVNKIAARLRREDRLLFPDWVPKKDLVPKANFRVQRLKGF